MAQIVAYHRKTFVVDSLKTLKEIKDRESSRDLESRNFIALDILRVDPIKPHLRTIKVKDKDGRPVNVKLLYDVITFTSQFIHHSKKLEKVKNFLTGNTFVCPNIDTASTVAYEIPGDEKYDAISIDGTHFKKNGLITSTFPGGAASNAEQWTDEDYEMEKLNGVTREFSSSKNKVFLADKQVANTTQTTCLKR